MAVTLTVADLLAALRMGESDAETAEGTRLLTFATLTITKHAPAAPDPVQNEAAIRLCGYLFDQPFATRGTTFANAGRNSGAFSLLLPYRVHRAGPIGDAVDEAVAAADQSNPVVDVVVDVLAGTLTVTYANGSVRVRPLPTGGDDGGGVDLTARAAAAAAQATADEATTPDEATELVADFARASNPSGHLPAMRLGENPAEGTVPIVTAGGRSFRFVEVGTFGGADDPVARAAAAAAQATADSKDDAYSWAEEGNPDPIPAAKLAEAGGAATDSVARDAAATIGPREFDRGTPVYVKGMTADEPKKSIGTQLNETS